MLSQDERRRYDLVLKNGEQLFNRLNSDIYHSQSKNLSLTGFLTANLSIIVILIIFLFEKGWNPSLVGYILIAVPIILISIALFLTFKNYVPGKFLELDMFDDERFKEVIQMSERDMYSDFIYHYKEAFKYNKNEYNRMVQDLKISLWIYLSAVIILLALVVVIIFGGI